MHVRPATRLLRPVTISVLPLFVTLSRKRPLIIIIERSFPAFLLYGEKKLFFFHKYKNVFTTGSRVYYVRALRNRPFDLFGKNNVTAVINVPRLFIVRLN